MNGRLASIFEYFDDIKYNKGSNIRYYNFWKTQTPAEMWLTRFIKHRAINHNYSGKINIYSVLGSVDKIKCLKKGVNIFFSGENLNDERFTEYRNVLKNSHFDLYIGFDKIELENHIRFPLWILYMFEPESTFEDICQILCTLNRFDLKQRNKFCALVASHDWNGIRTTIMDSLNQISLVESGGKYRNNSNELFTKFNDNKKDYISEFKFNICPENSNCQGYVTEKIFESIIAGCIPIYWGSNNNPEPDVLNKSSILFWDENGDNSEIINLVCQLQNNDSKYVEFLNIDRFKEDAAYVIWDYFNTLEQSIITAINTKG